MKLRRFPLVVLLASISFGSTNAQTTVATDPVGFVTLTVRAKTNNARALTMAVLPMERAAVYSGACGGASFSVNGNGQSVITFTSNLFTANQFTGAGNQHYFRVENGSNAGDFSTIVANSANSITLADNFSQILADTTTFTVTPYWTLGTAFPNGAGLRGGSSSTAADNILIYNTNFTPTTYYYRSNAVPPSWFTGATPSSNAIIPPGTGFAIERKANTPVDIVLPGTVPLGWSSVDINGSPATNVTRNTLVGSAYPLASRRLADLGLYTGNSNTGLVGGSSPTAADLVTIYNPATGSSTNYYFRTNAVPPAWFTGATPSDNVTIPAGSAVLIQRKARRPSFTWYIPQPVMNLD